MDTVEWFSKIAKVQTYLQKEKIDGWLLYDFKRLNPLALNFLEIHPDQHLTRRFFYWIPQKGAPVKLVSSIENPLEIIPGKTVRFATWQELEKELKALLKGSKKVAMEYSPRGETPEVSKVDAGTVELVREMGVEVVSSGDIYQEMICVWSEKQLQTHLKAAKILDDIACVTWGWIRNKLIKEELITERDVQRFIFNEINKRGAESDSLPIVAVNAHAANPHYSPPANGSSLVKKGDFILIDLWCKVKEKGAVYADITRVGVVREKSSELEQKLFDLVKKARDAAVQLVRERMKKKEKVFGWEVDQAAREVITRGGYGTSFIHRTGHNIHETPHGPGAHNDNFETIDRRELIRGTCCSVEPGIYLPGQLGVRLEFNLYIHHDGRVEITGGEQTKIECIHL